MARGKPLSQLSSDLRSGLALGMEIAARNITMELKRRGPYWTGQFEAAWEVAAGQMRIDSNLGDQATWDQIKNGPKSRQITPVFVPPADERLLGYTIGNLMEYADIAMDLEPGFDGRYRWERARATAVGDGTKDADGNVTGGQDWFARYILGGEGSATLGLSVKQGMRLAGFTR